MAENPRPYIQDQKLEETLAAIRDQVQFVKDWFLKLDDGLPQRDDFVALRRKYHAPVHDALDKALALLDTRFWREVGW